MKVAFRVDASIDMGTGHVMRCLTLADELSRLGSECLFITRARYGNMEDVIRERGYELFQLSQVQEAFQPRKDDVAHAHWLGTSWEKDSEETRAAMANFRPDWLIVDHYGIDARWHVALRDEVGEIMVIDDLADRPHDCSLLLDQNLGRQTEDYSNLVPDHCTIFVGPKYALLRPEFAALREYSLQRRKNAKVHQLLITMGGVDQHNATGRVLTALSECQLPIDCRIILVMGSNAPWLEVVQQQAEALRWHVEVLVNIKDMAQRMADSDLAIGAAGATSWERCCLGLPTLLVVLADNQKDAADHLNKTGITSPLELDETLDITLKNFISDVFSGSSLLDSMTENACHITRGEGCQWVVKKITRRNLNSK